jgi:hypothetical protein
MNEPRDEEGKRVCNKPSKISSVFLRARARAVCLRFVRLQPFIHVSFFPTTNSRPRTNLFLRVSDNRLCLWSGFSGTDRRRKTTSCRTASSFAYVPSRVLCCPCSCLRGTVGINYLPTCMYLFHRYNRGKVLRFFFWLVHEGREQAFVPVSVPVWPYLRVVRCIVHALLTTPNLGT